MPCRFGLLFLFVGFLSFAFPDNEGNAQNASTARQVEILQERLRSELEAVESALAEQDSGQLLAELEGTNRNELIRILRERARQGSGLAGIYLRIFETELFQRDLPVTISDSDFQEKNVPECLRRSVSGLIALRQRRLEEGIQKIGTAPDSEFPSIMREALDAGIDLENQPFCLRFLAEFGGEANRPLSVQWNSQCYQDEATQPDGVFPLSNPTTASILFDRGDGAGSRSYCSGTLITPNLVLTAAHCLCHTGARQNGGAFFASRRSCVQQGRLSRGGSVQSALSPNGLSVYFQHEGRFAVARTAIHPGFRWTPLFPLADLAVLQLENPVENLIPTPINEIGRLLPGTEAKGAGYGFHRPYRSDGSLIGGNALIRKAGLKFEGRLAIGRCGRRAAKNGVICWTRKESNAGRQLGSTCNGDSGGPIFAERNGRTYLVAVVSAGQNGCRIGSPTWNMSVYHHRRWIREQMDTFSANLGLVTVPSHRDQRVCTLCPSCDSSTLQRDPQEEQQGQQAVLAPGTSLTNIPAEEFFKIEVTNPSTDTLVVSANCNSDTGYSPAKFALTNENSREKCEVEKTGTTFTCSLGARAPDSFRIDFTGSADRECQITATEYGR